MLLVVTIFVVLFLHHFFINIYYIISSHYYYYDYAGYQRMHGLVSVPMPPLHVRSSAGAFDNDDEGTAEQRTIDHLFFFGE